ncbi:MAG: anhydro-N-acetylmuramic acid kinase [Saprospiraceae bacterium]|nr:anhydro-N-acetylmuramic acid kinase [Saprospiraceae bacterium]
MGWRFIKCKTIAYPDEWYEILRESPQLSGHQLNLLDNRFGYFVGLQAADFCKEHNLNPELVGWHGHTVFHDPAQRSTCQIGHGAALAAAVRIPVVTQFRQMDLSLGGQGAPLAPLADKMLLDQADFYLNLGGISNISFEDEAGKLRSFDISPCNQVLNRLANEMGKEYDPEGSLAAMGTSDMTLFNELNALPYYSAPSPKSIDNNWVTNTVWPIVQANQRSIHDKLATFSQHIAWQIAQVVLNNHKNQPHPAVIYITGGGAFNKYLIDQINQNLQRINREIILPSSELIQFKEAALMGLMAYLFVKGLENVYSDVTGSSEDHIGGCLFQAPGNPKLIYG